MRFITSQAGTTPTTTTRERRKERTEMTTHSTSTKVSVALWTVQGLLALTFIFAGSMKLVLPIEELTKEMDFPGWFLRFIGVCELLGGLGLILPGLARIRPGLTPLAAAGLVVIIVGAVVTTLAIGGGAGALFPFGVGLLLVFVAYGRTQLAPQPERRWRRLPALRPAF